MDENSASDDIVDPTPIFGAYRRGYDPDQVDRYVSDQRRRLDEALNRASEAERRLAAAVGQLRELHRRVAVLESEERNQQPQPLDTLGERVQRILQEAWDGAYAIRQSVELETNELKDRAASEAEEIVTAAQRKAEAAEEEIARRRRAYLERIEQDRSRTASQMTYLHEQKTLALAELNRIKTLIEATVSEVDAGADPRREASLPEVPARQQPAARGEEVDAATTRPAGPATASDREPERELVRAGRPGGSGDRLAATMPVHRLDLSAPPEQDRSALVQSHRAVSEDAPVRELSEARERRSHASVFDFELDGE